MLYKHWDEEERNCTETAYVVFLNKMSTHKLRDHSNKTTKPTGGRTRMGMYQAPGDNEDEFISSSVDPLARESVI